MKYIMHLTLEELEQKFRSIIREELSLIGNPENEPAAEEPLVKVEVIADLFKVSKTSVRNWVKKGLMPCRWMGSRQFFLKSAALEAMKNNFKLLKNNSKK